MTTVLPAGKKKELGQVLVQSGRLTAGQLTAALARQRQTGKPLGQALVDMELLEEEDVTRARAHQGDIAYVLMDDVVIDKSVLALISPAVAHKYALLPVGRTADGTLKIVVAQWNARVMDIAHKIATAHRLRLAPALATEEPLRAMIEQVYGPAPRLAPPSQAALAGQREERSALPVPIPQPPVIARPSPNGNGTNGTGPMKAAPEKRASEVFAGTLSGGTPTRTGGGGSVESLEDMGVDQPAVIQFISRILSNAILEGVSDIHFEPRRDCLDVRYRQDGVLRHVDSVRREFQSACSSRIKIMAEMNIAERRLPQDGRISVMVDGRCVDMRVSSLPTQYGESVVLRILDKTGTRPQLNNLGFSDYNLQRMNGLIRKPHGIFLATGPTGSGKTTTLYSAIHEIHTPDVNIITVEDPIEYELDGIRQSNVNEKAGLTFARQLRAILRQDPDIIYVGEIRDAETAEIAFRAALTGHLVFSTLHCNDAAGAVTRLLNMGMDPFLVASTVVGVLAQRLVRKVCVKCAQPYTPSETELAAFAVDPASPDYASANFQSGAGCDACAGAGYKGRYSVQELMVMDDTIRSLTLSRTPSHKIRHTAMEHGMVSMRQDAVSKIMQGITTFEEAGKRVYVEESGEE